MIISDVWSQCDKCAHYGVKVFFFAPNNRLDNSSFDMLRKQEKQHLDKIHPIMLLGEIYKEPTKQDLEKMRLAF